MGTIIDHATVTAASRHNRRSALRLAVVTAKACLEEGDCSPGELDLLINTGLYRDRDLGEPALAALIQEDIGANPEDPHSGAHGTFSFDIANGVCGPLTALHVIDGFFRSGSVHRALIVASDADPGHGIAPDFPYAAVGGALLCRWADDDSGLHAYTWANFPDGGQSCRTIVSYEHGRNRMRFEASDTADDVFAAAASKVAAECLGSASIDPGALDLIVAAPAHAGFIAALASHLSVPVERIAAAPDERTHTAALIAALHAATATGRAGPGSTVLLVAAAAGVTAGAALYRVPDLRSDMSDRS